MDSGGEPNSGAQVLRLLAQGCEWTEIQRLHPELASASGRQQLGQEADRLEQHGLLFAILEHIPDMIFVKEASELRFVLLNRAGELLLGTQAGLFRW